MKLLAKYKLERFRAEWRRSRSYRPGGFTFTGDTVRPEAEAFRGYRALGWWAAARKTTAIPKFQGKTDIAAVVAAT
jgi:hypothetical protein